MGGLLSSNIPLIGPADFGGFAKALGEAWTSFFPGFWADRDGRRDSEDEQGKTLQA